jgi:hypothetical protein
LGSNGLKVACSFTLVIPLQAKRAAAKPFGVKPLKCSIVMFCRRLMLANAERPSYVTEQYDKFICNKQNEQLPLAYYIRFQCSRRSDKCHTCLRFWEHWATGCIALLLISKHFLMSNTTSCLHPTAIADIPFDETWGHPIISSTFNLEHHDNDIDEASVNLSL